jgi:hypothetical protein
VLRLGGGGWGGVAAAAALVYFAPGGRRRRPNELRLGEQRRWSDERLWGQCRPLST